MSPRRKIFLSLLIVSGLMMILFNVSLSAFFQSFERPMIRLVMRLRPNITPTHVIIVAIDDDSLNKIGRWPWPQEELEQIQTIIDQLLPAVLAVNIVQSEEQRTPKWPLESIAQSRIIWRCLPSVVETRKRCGPGALDLDNNGYVFGLRWPTRRDKSTTMSRLPFALEAAAMYSHTQMMDLGRVAGRIETNFYGPAGTFRTYSAANLSNENPADIARHIVVLGDTAKGLADIKMTPFGYMSDTEVQANIIESVVSGQTLRRNMWANLTFIVTVFILCFLMWWYRLTIISQVIIILLVNVVTFAALLINQLVMPITLAVFLACISIACLSQIQRSPPASGPAPGRSTT